MHDERFAALVAALRPLEAHLQGLIDEQRRAEEEQASRQLLRAIQRAFREAMLALPPEEYDWFDIQARARQARGGRSAADAAATNGRAGEAAAQADEDLLGASEPEASAAEPRQRRFFEHAGPLFGVLISPAASTVAVGETRRFTALPRDRSRRRVEEDLSFRWEIAEGGGELRGERDQQCEFQAPAAPCLARLRVTVEQRDVLCTAEALVTVTDRIDHIVPPSGSGAAAHARGLPAYTFERAAGEMWRSRFDSERNLIVVNSGHRDFVFASRSQALKLRYLMRLYVKELVLLNFAGLPTEQLLERMIELSLYTEEKL